MALFLPAALAIVQQVLQFVREAIQRGVSIHARDVRNQVRPRNFDLARGRVVILVAELLVFHEPHVNAYDPVILPNKPGKLVADRLLQGRREVDVDTLEMEFRIGVGRFLDHPSSRQPRMNFVTGEAKILSPQTGLLGTFRRDSEPQEMRDPVRIVNAAAPASPADIL